MIPSHAKRIRSQAHKMLDFSDLDDPANKLAAFKKFLEGEMAFIKERHREGLSGLDTIHARTLVIDELLSHLGEEAIAAFQADHPQVELQIAMVAIGGYGRSELCPLSDIDVMFLYPNKVNSKILGKAQKTLAEQVLYPLWDTGLKVGHSSRTIDDTFKEARSDIQTKTALLDSRFIAGSQPLYETFREAYQLFYRKENPKEYIIQRLQNQKDRRAKSGGSIFMQEPDIKVGTGGLRDYHNTLWMARVILNVEDVDGLGKLNYLRKEELKEFKTAYDYLLRVRNELHFISKRPTDLLSLENQPRVALALGYKESDILKRVEGFMRDYYRHAQIIYRISKIVEKRLALSNTQKKTHPLASMKEFLLAKRKERIKQIDGFTIRGSEIAAEEADIFKEDPKRLIRVFRHKQQNNVELDFDLCALIRSSLDLIDDAIRESEDANLSFRTILQESGNVYPTLSEMHELGVLGAFMPEFGRLTCLVQHEYYHRYTADIHTLHTIRELDNIFTSKEPIFERYRSELHKLRIPNLLYLILLLHDLGKADAIKGHALSGVRIAANILKRMNVSSENRKKITYIIENHLEMARFWQRYDLDDPETARAFAEQTGSPEILRFLYIHTFCDARGTARGLWNNYKDALHTTLFSRSLDVLSTDEKLEEQMSQHKEMTRQELIESRLDGVSEEEIEAHFNLLPDRYFINTSRDEIVLHIKLVNQLLNEIANAETLSALKPVIDWHHDVNRSFTVVNVVTWDRAGLFHKLAGALNIAGYSILSAKAISRKDHIAIDTFYVTEGTNSVLDLVAAHRIFEQTITESLTNEEGLYPQIKSLSKKSASDILLSKKNPLIESFQPKVDVYHEISLRRTILEVQAPDSIGLLYQISHAIFMQGFDISFARISTERGIAIDTLYISSSKPDTDTESSKLMELRDSLSDMLAGNLRKSAEV